MPPEVCLYVDLRLWRQRSAHAFLDNLVSAKYNTWLSPIQGAIDFHVHSAPDVFGRSVMLFDGALWHGAGANTSSERRFAFSCAYCWGWMRQQENLQLGIPRETAMRFPRRLQELCGYSVYKGQFGHIDNRDPIELLGRERGTAGSGSGAAATSAAVYGWRGRDVTSATDPSSTIRPR